MSNDLRRQLATIEQIVRDESEQWKGISDDTHGAQTACRMILEKLSALKRTAAAQEKRSNDTPPAGVVPAPAAAQQEIDQLRAELAEERAAKEAAEHKVHDLQVILGFRDSLDDLNNEDEVRKMCPYLNGDDRLGAWLQGYRCAEHWKGLYLGMDELCKQQSQRAEAALAGAVAVQEAIIAQLSTIEQQTTMGEIIHLVNNLNLDPIRAGLELLSRMENVDRTYVNYAELEAHHNTMRQIFPDNEKTECAGCHQPIPPATIYRCYDCAEPFHRLCCKKHHARVQDENT